MRRKLQQQIVIMTSLDYVWVQQRFPAEGAPRRTTPSRFRRMGVS